MAVLLACWYYPLLPSISQLPLSADLCGGKLKVVTVWPNFLDLLQVTGPEGLFIYRKDFLHHHYLVWATEAREFSCHSFNSVETADY